MEIDSKTGLLKAAPLHLSPNRDARPNSDDISGIVIHNISLPPGEFGGDWIDDLFLNRLDATADPYFSSIATLRVSAHLLIRRDGQIIQYVPFHQRAWHAGQSNWDGRPCCNDFTIGIELEGTDDLPFATIQYQQLTTAIQALCQHYSALTASHIRGHQHISPGRKTDPGPHFDWAELKKRLALQ